MATTTPRSAIGRALAAQGRPVGWCRACGREFDASVGYTGAPARGLPRLSCSEPCRTRTAALRRTVLTAHRHTWADLAALHALEDDGQLSLPTLPLPPTPAPPLPPSQLTDEPLPLEP